jgi:hypothetical protein
MTDIMGKNKSYKDMETTSGSTYRASGTRSGRSGALPSVLVNNMADDISLATFWKVCLMRFRRRWVSIKFRVKYVRARIFNGRTMLKVGVLVVATYYLFGDQLFRVVTQTRSSIAIDWSEATNLGIGSEHKKKASKKGKKDVKSEAAPVSADLLNVDQSAAYIQKFSRIACEEMKKYGVPASISLAQGLVESRAGTSKLAVSNQNHFGLKCFSRNCKKGHCTNFTDDTHKDFFLKFGNARQSWQAHSKLLASGRYAKLKKYGRNYRLWAEGLKNAGYATDNTYAEKLIDIIERYELHQFDR